MPEWFFIVLYMNMMEQQLVNALIRLLSKIGGDALERDLSRARKDNTPAQTWTPSELEKALEHVNWQVENFGPVEASAVIQSLIQRYGLRPESIVDDDHAPEPTGIKGLQ